MSREIKFRAWYEQRKQMYYDVGLMWNVTVLPTAPENENAIGLPIMQFTGLKDKNGKEIYEGDVVCWRGLKWVIKYEHNSFFMDLIGKTNCAVSFEESEVIGNIYENPELLGDKK